MQFSKFHGHPEGFRDRRVLEDTGMNTNFNSTVSISSVLGSWVLKWNNLTDHFRRSTPNADHFIWRKPSVIWSYGIAILSVAAAVLIAHWPPLYLQSAPLSLTIWAVVISAWFGGVWSGLLATTLSALAFYYFFLPPVYLLAAKPEEMPRLFAFVVTQLFVCLLTFRQRSVLESLRRAHEEIKKSEDRLRLVIDTTPALIHSARPDGYIEYFNQRWLDYVGLSLQDMAGWGWTRVNHPDDVDRIVTRWRSSLESGEPLEEESRLQRADGEYRWMLHRKVPLRDQNGKILYWYGSSIDIEDRKRAEEAVSISEQKLQDLLKVVPAGVYTCDLSGRITFYNKRAVELWGREPSNFEMDRYCGSFHIHNLDGSLLPHDLSPMAEAVRTGQVPPPNTEVIVERPDGSRIIVMVNIAIMTDQTGERIGAINSFQDITELKNTETSLERANQEIERAFQEIKALKDKLQHENLALREEIDKTSMFEEIVGSSPVLHAVLTQVSKVAPTETTVLISGETGTGKELIARAIHKRSQRSLRAFVSVNCSAIPRDLIASELFGHEKGAFTGATQRRLGRFELAEGGTIFLDEVGELPTETQTALLRVLQEREFQRVGGDRTIQTDVRVIAATNRDLQAAIAAGGFRSDLFYRLNVFPIEVPPLRQRKEDIPLLVEYYIHRYANKAGKKILGINKKSLDLLQSYSWPGNIRELQNVIERAVIVCDTENLTVDESWFSHQHFQAESATQPLSEKLATQEKEMIEAALAESGGRVSGPSGAAAKLGIPQSTLDSKIKSLHINKHQFRPN